MVWASMPEAPIHEDGDLFLCEHDVGSDTDTINDDRVVQMPSAKQISTTASATLGSSFTA
jgi:hypothetical protein